MSLSNYTDITQYVADTLARSDLTTSFVGTFIQAGLDRIHYGSDHPQFPSDPLRIRAMETSATVSLGPTAAIPTGYLEAIRFKTNTTPIKVMSNVAPTQLYEDFPNGETGVPVEFTMEGDNFVFGPAPDGSYTGSLLYYKKFSLDSGANSVNWLTTNYPMMIVYAALIEAAPFIQDDKRLPMWFALFSGAVGALNGSNKRDRWSGSILTIRTDTGIL